MITIIAGSRGFPKKEFLNFFERRHLPWTITEVVGGKAKGPDSFGEEWAEHYGVPFSGFPANWLRYGKPAGMVRNKEMADYAEALLVFWDGESRGTANMIYLANQKGLRVYVVMQGDYE